IGLTGADVERIVKDAVRRARKEQRALLQSDLLAEITGRPRSEEGIPRLSAQQIERVAYHEAGHAIATFLSQSKGQDIGFVSVVPRSNGTLGFVARLAGDRVNFTRAE